LSLNVSGLKEALGHGGGIDLEGLGKQLRLRSG
jgi:hypothetical protein